MTRSMKRYCVTGPGGLHCACCRPGKNLKESKVIASQAVRRKLKIETRKELAALECDTCGMYRAAGLEPGYLINAGQTIPCFKCNPIAPAMSPFKL